MDMTKVMNFSQVSVKVQSSAKTADMSSAVRPVEQNNAAADKSSGNTSFHKVLHEARDSGSKDEVQNDAAAPAADQGKDEVQEDVSAQQNPAQDPLSAALAASQQASQQNAQEVQNGQAAVEDIAAVTVLTEAVQPQIIMAADDGRELQNAIQTMVQTDGTSQSGQTAAQAGSIEALLTPTDTAEAAKSQQLLAMLSGTGVGMKTARTGLQNAVQISETMPQAASAETAADKTAAANLAATVLNTTALNMDSRTAATDDANAAKTAVNEALQGTVVTVEQPSDTGAGFQQDAQQQNQQAAQQGQAVPAAALQDGAQTQRTLQQTVQLPEEAAQDKASVGKTENTTSTTGTAQLNAAAGSFQQNLQDVASLGSPNAQAAQPQTNYDIPRQIVDQAKLIKSTEDTQMVIKLKPEHLGELTLKVSVSSSGAVNASFHTDNAQVRGIIESSMVQLKQELQAQGLKVDNVGVYAGLGDGSLPNSQQGQAGYQQQSSNVRSQRADLASFEEETEAAAAAAGTTTTDDGIDYRI